MDLRVRRALRTYDWRTVELEFRMGRNTGTCFDPDVGHARFRDIKARADAWAADATDPLAYLGCMNTVERSVGDLRACSGDVRSVGRKRRVADVDYPAGRLSVSLEADEPADTPVPPGGHLRRKCRHSYAAGPWRIDLTRVMASADVDCDDARYEVEVELADRDELFRVPLSELLAVGARTLQALDITTSLPRPGA